MPRHLTPAGGITLSRGLFLLLTLPVLSGCATLFPPPTVRIVGVELAALGLTSGTAEVTLEVTNQRSRSVEVRDFLYNLEVQEPGGEGAWVVLAEGLYSEGLVLEGDQVSEVVIPVVFQYSTLGAAVRSFLTRGEIPYRLSGEVRVGGAVGFKVPFRSDGVLKP